MAAQFDDWEHLTPFTVPEVMASDLWTARRVNEVPAAQGAEPGSCQHSNRIACVRSPGPIWRASRGARGRRSRGATPGR